MLIKQLIDNIIGIQKLFFIEENKSAYDAAKYMVKHRCGALLVCKSNKNKSLTGIITERDLAFRVIPKNLQPSET